MYVAYLIFSYHDPEQVARLARVLRRESPGCSVAIRHDQTASRLDPALFADDPRVRVLESGVAVEWGSYSQVQALLDALASLLERERPDWITVLSGQDYPVIAPAQAERDLAALGVEAVVGDAWRLHPRSAPGSEPPFDEPGFREQFRRRYLYRHYAVPTATATALERVLRGPLQRLAYVRRSPIDATALVGVRAARTPFSGARPCWVSSDWFDVSADAARQLLATLEREPLLERHYRRTPIPTESLFATVLMASGLRISTAARHWVAWADGAARPDVLVAGDFGRIVGYGRPFARKVDIAVDSEILDALDAHRAQALG